MLRAEAGMIMQVDVCACVDSQAYIHIHMYMNPCMHKCAHVCMCCYLAYI
jgi:hypothetical protein